MRPTPEHVVGYGQHIYAYCNVRTNQVLYSLRRNLKDSALKQLPDIGANHTPPTIRPDLWKPLYNVTLPSSEQGLRLFRKLKEWKKVHELSWEPPSYLSEKYTEKQIEELQEKLDGRGGSKKETVYDVIKRQKKKMRQKIIMNQKANSIADLAAVLIEQEEEGIQAAATRKHDLERKLLFDRKLIITLAEELDEGGLKKADDEIEAIQKILREGAEGQKGKLRRDADVARQRREKMVYADAAVREAKSWAQLSPAERKSETESWKAFVEEGEFWKPKITEVRDMRSREAWEDGGAFASTMHHEYGQTWEQIAVACRAEGYAVPQREVEPKPEVGEVQEAEEPIQASGQKSSWNMFSPKKQTPLPEVAKEEAPEGIQALDYKTVLPCFPPRLDAQQTTPRKMPKRSENPYGENRFEDPMFTAEGVKVEWANFLDAEFARAWPEGVHHERMAGNKERVELLQQQRNEREAKYQSDLAEMVAQKRVEMGLPTVPAMEVESWETFEEGIEEGAAKEKSAEGKLAEESAVKEHSAEEIAAELAEAEELEAKEAEAQEAGAQALKEIRLKRRLPPQLEHIQSEILARVQAKAIQRGWKGAPRRQPSRAPVVPETADSRPPPTGP